MPRFLGVDYGQKRIGFAVSDPGGEYAMPLCMVEVRGEDDAVRQVCRVAEESEVDGIVVGLPLNMNGSRGPAVEKTDAFVKKVASLVRVPVDTCDERLSTCSAERTLIEADLSRQKRKGLRDKLAAQIILQGYLDARSMKAGMRDGSSETAAGAE
jgi:putative holliday junction resolvase